MKTFMTCAVGVLILATLSSVGAREADDRVWIGIELDRSKAGGVRVKRVVEGSPGERAHLRAGDEVVAVDGAKVSTPEQVIGMVHVKAAGAVVRLKLAGKKDEVAVRLESRPNPVDMQRRALQGRAAPDFAPAVQAGPKLARLSALKGQVVLLDFFATWCGPCMQALPRIEALHRELGPRGLRIVGVSDESPQVVAGVARRGVDYTLASDAEDVISARYQVTALPTMVVIDRAGVVRLVSIADEDAAERTVRALLDEKQR